MERAGGRAGSQNPAAVQQDSLAILCGLYGYGQHINLRAGVALAEDIPWAQRRQDGPIALGIVPADLKPARQHDPDAVGGVAGTEDKRPLGNLPD